MLIFWKERLVFLSTPKAGSTSIETALESLAHVAIRRPPELKHMSATAYGRHVAPLLESAAGERFTTVALMREPIDWLGSWYRYRQRDDLGEKDKSTRGMSFDDAAGAYMGAPAAAPMDVGSQARFIGGDEDRPGVDRLFRYEAIDQFVDFLEDRLGCEIILPRLNVSPKGPVTLSPAVEERLRRHLARDYALYGRLE
jgi:hypothetical protein